MVCFSCGVYGHKQGECRKEGEMEKDDTGLKMPSGQSTHSAQTKAQSARIPEQVFKDDYGSWMLVTKSDRRGQRRGGKPQTTGQRNAQRAGNSEHVQTSSRFAMLEGFEENEVGLIQDTMGSTPINNNTRIPLPRIRTTQQQGNTDYSMINGSSRVTSNQGVARQTQTATLGTSMGRGGHGAAPRRAAAESEHTVVRGSNRGKHITTTVFHHANDQPESSYVSEFGFNFKENPSDVARVFTNPVFQSDEVMQDADQTDGLMVPGAEGLLRS